MPAAIFLPAVKFVQAGFFVPAAIFVIVANLSLEAFFVTAAILCEQEYLFFFCLF